MLWYRFDIQNIKRNGYSVYSSDLIDRGYGEETGIDF